jgi:Gas vesicle protein
MANDTGIQVGHARASGLVDVLDRILDKGLVVAGDIKISIAEVELLTIRIRLLVCSIDKAEQIGLDWWKHDRHLSTRGDKELAAENEELRKRIRRLEGQLEWSPGTAGRAPRLRAKRLDRK